MILAKHAPPFPIRWELVNELKPDAIALKLDEADVARLVSHGWIWAMRENTLGITEKGFEALKTGMIAAPVTQERLL